MFDLRDDGRVAIRFPAHHRSDGGQVVLLRRPTLDELFVLWERLDVLAVRADGAPATGAIRMNMVWLRYAIATLGRPAVYADTGELDVLDIPALALIRTDIDEPAWFVGTLSPQLLAHWQNVPTGPWINPDAKLSTTRVELPEFTYPSHRAFYSLWYALAQVNISPLDAGRMEVWQVAATLGVGIDVHDEANPAGADTNRPGPAPVGAQGVPADDLALIRARVAHARGQGPKPEAAVTDSSTVGSMSAAFSGRV